MTGVFARAYNGYGASGIAPCEKDSGAKTVPGDQR